MRPTQLLFGLLLAGSGFPGAAPTADAVVSQSGERPAEAGSAAPARETGSAGLLVSSPAAAPDKERPTGRTIDELLLFAPARHPIGDWQPAGLKYEDVWFTANDGTRLHGWYCPGDSPRAHILYVHGNAGNITHRRPVLQHLQEHLRVSVLIFDYRGYGRSAGSPTVAGILQDARAARALLAQRARIKESGIVLMGRSLGGAVAVQLAVEKRPRGLVLESTFSSLRDVAAHHYPMLAWLVPEKKLNSAAVIGTYKGPLLQSHGAADRTIPFALGARLFQAANEPKAFITIRGGGHNAPQSPRYYQELEQFLDRL